jgi:hypothetical protein
MFKETTTLYIPEDVAVAGGTDAIVCVCIYNGRLYNLPEKMDYSRLGGCRERVHRVRTAAEREREKRVLYSCRSHSIYTVYISISSAWRESKKTHKSSSSLTSTVFFFFFLVCSFTISLFLYSLEFLSFSPATPNNLTGLHGSQRERRVLAYTLW